MLAGLAPLLDRLGQLFWIGFQGTGAGDDLRGLLSQVQPGGLILFSRNIETDTQVRRLTSDLSAALDTPPFIALDQEGGRVNRLKGILGPIAPNLRLAGRPDAPRAVARQARALALALRTLGFNVNLAPVLDLSGPETSNGIGDRAFGPDPDVVSRLARVFLKTHLDAGILPVGKHFPGLGPARGDTHLTLPRIDKSRAALWREDLLPYRRLRSLLPIVMAGHAWYPDLQGPRPGPATLSEAVVTGLLRRRMRYRGLIVTDDLEMGAVEQNSGAAAQALAALEAGNDGLMFCSSADRIRDAWEGVRRAVERGEVNLRRVRQSLDRIAALKKKHRLGRRLPALSAATLDRSRRTLAALGPSAEPGFDPTARA